MRRGIRANRGRVGLGAALALWATGCHWLPLQQVTPSLDPRRVSRAPATAAMAATETTVAQAAVPLPETPLQAISDAEALAATAPASAPTPAPTPLLDAAMVQAQAVQDVMTGAMPPDPLAALMIPTPATTPTTLEPAAVATAAPRDEAVVQAAAVAEANIPEALPGANPAVTAELAPEPEPVPEPAPVLPEDAWRTHFEALRVLAREREAASDGEPWPLRAAVLDWLGDGGPQQHDSRTVIWSAFIESLAQTTTRAETAGVDASAGPADDPALREVIDTLEEHRPLRVGTLALCRKVQGFGQYEPIAEPSCRAGQTVVLYCELEGLRYEPGAGNGLLRSRLESTVVLRADEGDRVLWSQSLGTAEDICRRRRRDYYVNYRLTLPDAATLAPGTYRLQIQQRDAIAGTEATAEIPLTIAATPNG